MVEITDLQTDRGDNAVFLGDTIIYRYSGNGEAKKIMEIMVDEGIINNKTRKKLEDEHSVRKALKELKDDDNCINVDFCYAADIGFYHSHGSL